MKHLTLISPDAPDTTARSEGAWIAKLHAGEDRNKSVRKPVPDARATRPEGLVARGPLGRKAKLK